MANSDRTICTMNAKSTERKTAKMGSSEYGLFCNFAGWNALMRENRPMSLLVPVTKICMTSGRRYASPFAPIQDDCVRSSWSTSCRAVSYCPTAALYSRTPMNTLNSMSPAHTANVAGNFGLRRMALSSLRTMIRNMDRLLSSNDKAEVLLLSTHIIPEERNVRHDEENQVEPDQQNEIHQCLRKHIPECHGNVLKRRQFMRIYGFRLFPIVTLYPEYEHPTRIHSCFRQHELRVVLLEGLGSIAIMILQGQRCSGEPGGSEREGRRGGDPRKAECEPLLHGLPVLAVLIQPRGEFHDLLFPRVSLFLCEFL